MASPEELGFRRTGVQIEMKRYWVAPLILGIAGVLGVLIWLPLWVLDMLAMFFYYEPYGAAYNFLCFPLVAASVLSLVSAAMGGFGKRPRLVTTVVDIAAAALYLVVIIDIVLKVVFSSAIVWRYMLQISLTTVQDLVTSEQGWLFVIDYWIVIPVIVIAVIGFGAHIMSLILLQRRLKDVGYDNVGSELPITDRKPRVMVLTDEKSK